MALVPQLVDEESIGIIFHDENLTKHPLHNIHHHHQHNNNNNSNSLIIKLIFVSKRNPFIVQEYLFK